MLITKIKLYLKGCFSLVRKAPITNFALLALKRDKKNIHKTLIVYKISFKYKNKYPEDSLK